MSTPEEILADTSEQMLSPVQLYKTILKMLELGVTTFVEIGPGHGLTGMVKKINSNAELMITKNVEELNRTMDRLAVIMSSRSRTRSLVSRPELGLSGLRHDRGQPCTSEEDGEAQESEDLFEQRPRQGCFPRSQNEP